MKIQEIQEYLSGYTKNTFISFVVDKKLLIQDANREEKAKREYNKLIKEKVERKYGIYLWENDENKEIIYIGMAGKIKQNGNIGDHTINKRLIASREQVYINGKKTDVQTGDYLLKKMDFLNICRVNFYIIYLDTSILPPTYIESVLLFEYLNKKKQLPILNNSF
jgi:hypothetical protein